MRNLKKILALVLALIMSLSLMATASAAETETAETGSKYQTAIDVLKGVGVVKGDERGDRPSDSITRAEVAALLYRIATGDVADAQRDIHTGQGFTDVNANDWYAGYISYCYIDQIIKGNPNGSFEPDKDINGYATLAMILRAMGYGKNGEFEGDGWEIQTASTARRIGILDGIIDTQLSGPAARELVFEILFRAIFTDTVKFDAREPYVYPTTGENLAKKNLGLERLTGIVMANEYADLRDNDVEAAGKTVLAVGDNEYTLNVTTDLNDIGESRVAYVQADGKRAYNLVVDSLYDTGLNVRAETGAATSNVARFAKNESGINVTAKAEHFWNFGEDREYTSSEYQISYMITKVSARLDDEDVEADFVKYLKDYYNITVDKTKGDKVTSVVYNSDYNTWTWEAGKSHFDRVSIRPYTRLTNADWNCIQDIFYYAGLEKADEDGKEEVVLGEVYVGTQYTKDISDEISHRMFIDTYLQPDVDSQLVSSTENGEWLKVLDNNNDGTAEYVFATWYALDEITGYNSRYDYYTFESDLDVYRGYDAMYLDGYEPAVNDVVLVALIDGTAQIQKADTQVSTIKTVNYKDVTVTTTDDETFEQSGIENWTEYAEDIIEMDEKVSYDLFFDRFGYVRAYRLVEGSNAYALLTELYFTNSQNSKYLKGTTPIVELKAGDEKLDEFPVSNYSGRTIALKTGADAFVGVQKTATSTIHNSTYYTWLQSAISHLGTNDTVRDVDDGDNNNDGYEFDWTTAGKALSDTNVAKYVMNDDGTVAISPATAYAYNKAHDRLYYSDLEANGKAGVNTGDKVTVDEYIALYKAANPAWTQSDLNDAVEALQPVYAVDYVKLAIEKVNKGTTSYSIDPDDDSYNDRGYEDANPNWKGNYVSAVHDTQFYLVQAGSITYIEDYANVPAINADQIKAIYAVAENTKADVNDRDYWVANVIVIELTGWQKGFDSVSLAFFNHFKTTGDTKHLDTLNNESADPELEVVATQYGWANQWKDFGFYKLYGTEERGEKSITASSIDYFDDDEDVNGIAITESFNGYGVYAGLVKREAKVEDRGEYIRVNKTNDATADEDLKVNDVPVYAIIKGDLTNEYEALSLTTGHISVGDHIIWVRNNADNKTAFIVIADYSDRTIDYADWIYKTTTGLYQQIVAEQVAAATPDPVPSPITFENVKVKGKTVTDGAVSLLNSEAKSTVLVDLTFESNADKVTVIKNPTPTIVTCTESPANSDKWTTAATGTDISGVTSYTVVLTKGDASVEKTITVTVAAAASTFGDPTFKFKGVTATRKTTQPAGADGTTGKEWAYEVTLSTDDNASDKLMMEVTFANGPAGKVTIGTPGSGVTSTNYATGTGALNTANALIVVLDSEDGAATDVYYKFDIKVAAKADAVVTGVAGKSAVTAHTSTTNGTITFAKGLALTDTNVTDGTNLTIAADTGASLVSGYPKVDTTAKTITIKVEDDGSGILEDATYVYDYVEEDVTYSAKFNVPAAGASGTKIKFATTRTADDTITLTVNDDGGDENAAVYKTTGSDTKFVEVTPASATLTGSAATYTVTYEYTDAAGEEISTLGSAQIGQKVTVTVTIKNGTATIDTLTYYIDVVRGNNGLVP